MKQFNVDKLIEDMGSNFVIQSDNGKESLYVTTRQNIKDLLRDYIEA